MTTVLPMFFVPGKPKTKGSLDFYGRGKVAQTVRGSTRWAQMIEEVSRREYGVKEPMSGAVSVHLIFVLERDPLAERAGDIDKLARNVLDALKKAGVYGDDNQVVKLVAEKIGRNGTSDYGVWISAYERGE